MDREDEEILKRLEKEEIEEENYIEYLDGEISYVKECIKKIIRRNPRYKDEIEFFEDDLSSMYRMKEKFLLQCEKRQRERNLTWTRIKSRQFEKQLEDLERKLVPKVFTIESKKEEIPKKEVNLAPLPFQEELEEPKEMKEEEVEHSATIVQVEDDVAIAEFSTSKGEPKGRDEERERKESEKVGKEAESEKKESKQINGPLVSEKQKGGLEKEIKYAKEREIDIGQPILVKDMLCANNDNFLVSLHCPFVLSLQGLKGVLCEGWIRDFLPLKEREVVQRKNKWPPPIRITQVKSLHDLANYGSYTHEDWKKRVACVLMMSLPNHNAIFEVECDTLGKNDRVASRNKSIAYFVEEYLLAFEYKQDLRTNLFEEGENDVRKYPTKMASGPNPKCMAKRVQAKVNVPVQEKVTMKIQAHSCMEMVEKLKDTSKHVIKLEEDMGIRGKKAKNVQRRSRRKFKNAIGKFGPNLGQF